MSKTSEEIVLIFCNHSQVHYRLIDSETGGHFLIFKAVIEIPRWMNERYHLLALESTPFGKRLKHIIPLVLAYFRLKLVVAILYVASGVVPCHNGHLSTSLSNLPSLTATLFLSMRYCLYSNGFCTLSIWRNIKHC